MNADTARGEVFGDALACEEARPAAFHPGTAEPERLRAACLRSEGLLRALAVVEDSRGVEENEEYDPGTAALNRLEAKVSSAGYSAKDSTTKALYGIGVS